MTIREAVEKSICENEISGILAKAYVFSDPDGVHSGKSGWSFGRCQYDINNNSAASLCLKECGFTDTEIAALKAQTCDISMMDAKLQAHKDIVDKWDEKEVDACIAKVQDNATKGGFTYADDTAVVMACDYHNQFNFGFGGPLYNYCRKLGRPVTAEDIYKFKLTLPWVTEKGRKDDVDRRYKTVLKIMNQEPSWVQSA